jgi:sterol desaturase/sphingolipid hydroxylase (fatty acid hydroxylase superfamily)
MVNTSSQSAQRKKPTSSTSPTRVTRAHLQLGTSMTARECVTNVTIILTVMAVGALLETAVPMFGAAPWKQDRRVANLGLTALSFISNWVLASLAATPALSLRPAGLMAQLGWPAWIQIVAGIVILDFSVGYLSHRTMHMWPAMWRFEQIPKQTAVRSRSRP